MAGIFLAIIAVSGSYFAEEGCIGIYVLWLNSFTFEKGGTPRWIYCYKLCYTTAEILFAFLRGHIKLRVNGKSCRGGGGGC